jgi:DNA end-binding protein Ku
MAARASWKGQLKVGQLSCPVSLYAATTAADKVSFHILSRKTGHRVRQRMVDEASGEEVPREAQVRGFEYEKGQYVEVEPEDIERARPANTHAIVIEKFVEPEEVPLTRFDGAHFVAPSDKVGEECFVLLRDAMERNGVAALGRVVLSTRERLMLIQPRGKGMIARTVLWPHQVRSASRLFDELPDIEVPEEMLDIASVIVRKKKGAFKPAEFHDQYEEAMVELIRAKAEGRTPKKVQAPLPEKVVNLMDALKASAKAADKTAKKPPAKSTTRRRTAHGRERKRA